MAINTTFTTGAILTAAQMNNLPWGVISSRYDTAASLINASTAVQSFLNAPAFTPVAGRLYRCTYSIGVISKTTNNGNIDITMRKDSTSGAIINASVYSALFNIPVPFSTSVLLTSTQMGTASFVPTLCVQANTAGISCYNTGGYNGTILFEDIGAA
jgi:hypothetical protein